MYIKLYLSAEEKEKLALLAQKKGISTSRLCYEQIAPLLTDRFPFSMSEASNECGKLDHCINVYFSESEYQTLLKESKGLPLSKFIRRIYLSRKEPIVISVYTDDISALAIKVSAYIDRFNNFIAALALRQQLHETDYQKLIEIADNTQIALKEVATYVRNNRKSIRASGVRILRKEIQKAISQTLEGCNVS